MIADAELETQRFLTKWFIDADAEPVTVLRVTMVGDGAGGKRRAVAPLPVQTMRLIPQPTTIERKLEDGRVVTASHVLLGEHTADIQRGDLFEFGGAKFEVVFLHPNRQYEVKAEAITVG